MCKIVAGVALSACDSVTIDIVMAESDAVCFGEVSGRNKRPQILSESFEVYFAGHMWVTASTWLVGFENVGEGAASSDQPDRQLQQG